MDKDKITPKNLINWSKMSAFLTGSKENIKTKYIPKRWEEPVQELENLIQSWMDKHKE